MLSLLLLITLMSDHYWHKLHEEITHISATEPLLRDYLCAIVLPSKTLEAALAKLLSGHLAGRALSTTQLESLLLNSFNADATIQSALRADLDAFVERDSACTSLSDAFLFFKGFHALSVWRAAHYLWGIERKDVALLLQNRISVVYSVDIHPAAKIGKGILLDHASGIVIGETAVVEDEVSLLQQVTLGGTGKENQDRHPKVQRDVLIGAGSAILGNISIGEGAQIAPASVVLHPVEPHTLMAGVPAQNIGRSCCENPAREMRHELQLYHSFLQTNRRNSDCD